MKISAELFLLDNAMMNLCIFLLASVLSGIPIRWIPLISFSIGGAVYAFCSMFYFPVLRETWIKLLAFLTLALPMKRKGTSFVSLLMCVLLSAAMIGGVVLCITLLTGGTIRSEGTIVGTIPLRASLFGLAAALIAPRALRQLLKRQELKSIYTTVVVSINGPTRTLTALIDTGNLLTEPISGLPVLLIKEMDLPKERPIVCQTQIGQEVLFAARPQFVRLSDYGNCSVDCYLASAPQPIPDADAVLPAVLLPKKWRVPHEKLVAADSASSSDSVPIGQEERHLVRSYRRNAAGAARSGRRSPVHRRVDGEMGKG